MERRKRRKKKKFNWKKYAFLIAITALVLVCAAIYLLPYAAYYETEMAIASGNPGKLASCADLNNLRTNLKKQRGNRVVKDAQTVNAGDGVTIFDLAIQWAALQTDPAIDQAISTAGFYAGLSGPADRGRRPGSVKSKTRLTPYQMIGHLIANRSFEYKSHDEFVIRAKDDKNRYVEYFSFVFKRDGLNWRLANVILPLF